MVQDANTGDWYAVGLMQLALDLYNQALKAVFGEIVAIEEPQFHLESNGETAYQPLSGFIPKLPSFKLAHFLYKISFRGKAAPEQPLLVVLWLFETEGLECGWPPYHRIDVQVGQRVFYYEYAHCRHLNGHSCMVLTERTDPHAPYQVSRELN